MLGVFFSQQVFGQERKISLCPFLSKFRFTGCQRKPSRKHDVWWPQRLTWAMGVSSSLSLSLECIFCPSFPQWRPFSRMRSWEIICRWDHLGSVLNWTQLGLLCKLLRFQWLRAKICLPYRHQKHLSMWILLLIILPIRNHLPLSSVCPCLPWREVSFKISPRKIQGSQTNNS